LTYFALTVLFVLLGAYSIAAQVYFIRELLVIFFGNELCLGIIFAGWFAGIGLGATLGGRSCKKQGLIIPGFLISLVVLCLLPFLIIPVMRVIRAIFEVQPGGYASIVHIAEGTIISVCPFSFMVGFIFPVACRVLIGHNGKGSLEIGWVYVWESVGSLAGGLVISLLLIPRFSPMLVFACGSLLVFTASFLFACSLQGEKGLKVLRALFLILFVADVIALWSNALPEFDKYLEAVRWKTFNNRLRLIESRDSRYQNIVLAEAQRQYSIFANGNFISIYPDEYQSAMKAHFFLSQHPAPGQVLLIGGGITGLLREILKHPVESVDYVELDPELVQMIHPYLNTEDRQAVDDRRVTVFYMDGRRYVKEAAKKYDLIIVDTPDPSTALLNRFYTVDFFSEVRKILSGSGMLVTGMSSTADYVSQEIADYNGSLYRGLTRVFPFVMVVPGDRNYFFASTRGGLFSKDPGELSRRYERRNIHSKNFSPALFQWLVQKDRIEFVEGALKRKGDQLLNTDFHPVTYFYNLVIWDIISGEKDRFHIFQKIKGKGMWWFLAPVGLFSLIGCIAIMGKMPKRLVRFNCLWVIGTTGFAGMAMEIVLIFMFQSFYGYIYEKIGIVVALFMMGLAIGSYVMRNWLKKAPWIKLGTITVLEIIICAYVISVPFILHGFAEASYTGKGLFFSTEYLYFTLIFAIGLFAGMEFPLICHVLISSGYEGGNVAGWVDAMDHIGACFGAFLTGIILMPLFGAHRTCFIIALLKLTCIVFLVMTSRYGLSEKQS
jgi:spermidine synthase